MDGEGDDTLELTGDDILDEGDDQQQQQDEGDDLVIEIEGEEEPEEQGEVPRKLRALINERNKEIFARDKRIRELEQGRQAQPIEVGNKPDLWEDCEGDPDKYDAALLAYHDRKRQAEQAEHQRTQITQSQTDALNRANIAYRAKAETMGIKNIDQHEQAIAEALSPQHVGFIIQYSEKPAELIAALGSNPRALAQVVAEPDEMRRLAMLVRMEPKVTVKRKGPPPPELQTIQRGSASLSATADKKLEALEAKAAKSGDRSEVIAYKRQARQQAK